MSTIKLGKKIELDRI